MLRFVPAAVLCIGLAALPKLASAGDTTVFSIGDGDTLSVKDGGRRITVRLACIDAPEMAQRPYGQDARATLQKLVPVGTQVTLRIGDTDRYGRKVAEVWRGGTNVNLALVANGNAFAYRQYLKAPCRSADYLSAESTAKAAGRGVWSVPGGVTRPWDFRRGRRGGAASNGGSTGGNVPSAGGGASGRYRCREIGSFAKAQELLKQGHTYLDRDGDGIACESLR